MITPVLLCGGSGTRLWPLSRRGMPKQFGKLLGERTLFQASALRFHVEGFAPPLVVTANDFRFIVNEQLLECGIAASGILIEPQARNTAGAAIVAALHLEAVDRDATMVLVPSDHAITDDAAFRAAVQTGMIAADEGRIVTFGIAPDRPETGYGWLECGEASYPGVERLARFIEKPDSGLARTLFADRRFLWNSGVFLASARTLIAAFKEHAPETFRAAEEAFAHSVPDLGFTRLDAAAWSRVPENSIDFAVMEKARNVSVVRFDGAWSDMGSWEAVWQESPHDEAGNAVSGPVTVVDCTKSVLRSESADIELVGIGLENIVAVAMNDAVLVADMSQSQNVKAAYAVLKARGVKQATEFPVDHRPWGWFERLVIGERFQVKRIVVHPGAALSLQSHVHRSEHWIVVAGTARVTVDGTVSLITENQSIYVPLGAVHRMENPGRVPMVLIEVQTGIYLGEDDIVRYDDAYARV